MPLPAYITGVKSHDSGRTNSAVGGTGKVPHAKKPRSRPPTSLRDKLGFLQAHLPSYSGPYSVGSMDIEVPVDNPRTFSHITRDGHPLLRLETVLFTLYYPAAIGSGSGKDPGNGKKWSRETWLPRPRVKLAKGYGKFAGLPSPFAVAYFGATTSFTKLRAFRNSPVASHWPPMGNSKRQGHKIKNKQGPPPPGATDEPTFPLLLFSHGLGGTRTTYSTMCAEFASYGFVVCALEHRDGSGPRTFVNYAKGRERKSKGDDEEKSEDQAPKEAQKGHDTIDYVFPKDNPYDTSPSNEKGVDSELRNAQIELRLSELEEAYKVLCDICEGRGEEVAKRNLRRKGYVGGSSRGLEGVKWSIWRRRFHTDKVTVAGHSFGAATIVEVLRKTDRFPHVQAGIIYDIWGSPIKPPKEDPRHRIHLPILGINSEAFMYWQENFDAVMSLMNEAKDQGAPAFLCTVRGSIHISQSDFTILYPHVCSFFLKATVHPQRAIDLNISASLEFLRDVTEGAGKSIIQRCLTDEELLQTPLLDELPDEHRPDQEWIAARLKVPHEFRTRLGAKFQRKLKRKKAHGFYNPGDEIWMHFRPEPETVDAWRAKTRRAEDPGQEEVRAQELQEQAATDTDDLKEDGDEDASTRGERNDTWLGRNPALNTPADHT